MEKSQFNQTFTPWLHKTFHRQDDVEKNIPLHDHSEWKWMTLVLF